MGDPISQLRHICCQLDDSKSTTRKKAEGGLKDLLNNERIVRALHNSSDKFGWQDVYTATSAFVKMEIEKLITDERKEKQGKLALANRVKRKRELMAVLRMVLKKGAKKLSWGSVLNDLMTLVDHPFIRENFADDLVRIMDSIIRDPRSQNMIRVGEKGTNSYQWERLLKLAATILIEAPSSLDCLAAVQLLRSTIKIGGDVSNLMYVMDVPAMLKLVKSLLSSSQIGRGDTPTKLEAIGVALELSRHIAEDYRLEVCELGEATVHCILPSWDDRDTQARSTILQLLVLQMQLHHPGGARDSSEGAVWGDRAVWQHQLLRIQQNVIETTLANRLRVNRTKGSRSSLDYELWPEFLDLAVDVLRQTLTQEQRQLDITQLAPDQLDSSQAEEPLRKRLRLDDSQDRRTLDLSYKSLLDSLLLHSENDFTKIPRLQILAHLLKKYPDMIDDSVASGTARTLSNLLQNTKTIATKRHILSACISLAVTCTDFGSGDWDTIVRTSFNMLSMNQGGCVGGRLFQMLFPSKKGLFNLDQIYGLFTNQLIKISPESVAVLQFLLVQYPHHHHSTVSQGGQSIRDLFLQWLFPETGDEQIVDLAVRGSPYDFSRLLISLCIKYPDQLPSVKINKEIRLPLTRMEERLLEASLVHSKAAPLSVEENKTKSTSSAIAPLNTDQIDEVVSLLRKDVGIILSCMKEEVTSIRSGIMELQAILYFISQCEEHKISSFSASSILPVTARILLTKICNFSVEIISRNRDATFPDLIPLFELWINFAQSLENCHSTVRRFFFQKDVCPLAFFTKIEHFVNSVIEIKEKQDSQSQQILTITDTSDNDPFSDFDDGFNEAVTQSNDSNVATFGAENDMDTEQVSDCLDLKCLKKAIVAQCMFLAVIPEGVDCSLFSEKIINVLYLMMRGLDIFDFSPDMLETVFSSVNIILKSGSITDKFLDKCCEIVKEVARKSMTANTFNCNSMKSILSTICLMAPSANKFGSANCGEIMNKLLFGLVIQNSRLGYSRFGSDFNNHLVKAIAAVAQFTEEWSAWPASAHNKSGNPSSSIYFDSDENVKMIDSLSRFLSHESQTVRLETVRVMMETCSKNLADLVEQQLLQHFDDLLCEDDDNNVKTTLCVRINSGLFLSACGVSLNLYLSASVLSTILHLVSKGKINLSLNGFLLLVSQYAGFEIDTQSMMKTLLPGILHSFRIDITNIKEFPVKYFGYNSGDIKKFISENEAIVVPAILLNDQSMETLEELSTMLKVRKEDLILRNFCSLAQIFYPGIAAEENGINFHGKDSLVKLGNLAEGILRDDFITSIGKQVMPILEFALLHVNDLGKINSAFGINVTKWNTKTAVPLFPAIVPEVVLKSFDCTYDEPILDCVANTKPQLFLEMTINLCLGLCDKSSDMQLVCLFSLHLWLESFKKRITPKVKTVVPLLTQYLTRVLLSFMRKETTTSLLLAALVTLKQVVEMSVQKGEHFSNSLISLNSTLIMIITSSEVSRVQQMARDILELAFVTHADKFAVHIEHLEDYPNLEIFKRLNESSEKYKANKSIEVFVKRFLYAADSIHSSCTLNLLSQLKGILSLHHGDMGFLLETNISLIRKLIFKLLQLGQSSEAAISSMAAKCLGEIGPVDLDAHIFATESSIQLQADTRSAYVADILTPLNKLMMDSLGNISKEAYSAILNILNCTIPGQHFKSFDIVDGNSFFAEPLKKKLKTPLNNPRTLSKSMDVKKTLDDPILWIYSKECYPVWIRNVVCALLTNFSSCSVLGQLKSICSLSIEMCEKVLPIAVHELLQNVSAEDRLVISAKVNLFFKEVYDYNTSYASSRTGTPSILDSTDEFFTFMDKKSVNAMLDIVSYLRTQPLPSSLLSSQGIPLWESNFWIVDLNYLHVSKAALVCSAYSSSLLYANLWCFEQDMVVKSGSRKSIEPDKCLLTSLGISLPSQNIEEVKKIIRAASSSVADWDSVKGVCILSEKTDVCQIPNTTNLSLLDIRAETGHENNKQDIIGGLFNAGMFHVLCEYISSIPTPEVNPEINDYQMECFWRLEKWDKFVDKREADGFNSSVFGVLKSLENNETEDAKNWLTFGENCLLKNLRMSNLETCAEVYPILTKLMQLSELEKIVSTKDNSVIPQIESLWKTRDSIQYEFSRIEPVLSQSIIVLTQRTRAGLVSGRNIKLLEDCSLEVSRCAREAGMYWLCNMETEKRFSERSSRCSLERASVIWDQGHHAAAFSLGKKIVFQIERQKSLNDDDHKLIPQLLITLGRWSHHLKSESSSTILNNYFSKAITLLELETGQSNIQICTDAYIEIAKLADQHYKHSVKYMDSAEFDERRQNIEKRQKEVEILRASMNNGDKDLKTSLYIQDRFLKLDQAEIDRCSAEREEFLTTAVTNYLKVLKRGEGASLAFHRVLAIWFENHDNLEFNRLLVGDLAGVASHHMVPLLYQMAARMCLPGKNEAEFSNILFSTIKRVAGEHPHHTLPLLFALRNAKYDDVIEKKIAEKAMISDDKSRAADRIISQLGSISAAMDKVVGKYELMCRSMIEVAYIVPPAGKTSSSIGIPSSCKYVKIRDWPEIPVPTDLLPVKPNKDYSSFPGIVKFEPNYRLVGGINAPKKTCCLGTDGVLRHQMIKGKDDLRQDAVMQQVFGLMNQLLQRDKSARRERLRVRTYKILPLSQRSGILQWCDNTRPLADILVGSEGVHTRYFPRDLSAKDCAQAYRSAAGGNSGAALDKFVQICSRFTPAFKFFFVENFPTPGDYYLGRTAYAKSVATNSMVGHILGLGDRHINNILLDTKSGEMVHIDFGVAFDQGKILPTPETIPFRLSRDVVDGLGPTGVEGVFRFNCERSMRVLRANKEAVMTVLEVMLHDPLYNWSVGPGKAAAKQATGEWRKLKEEEKGHGNRMASRALLVLMAKLEGREEGGPLTVENQVSSLIQQAVDPGNLSRVYVGWSPWC